LGTVSRRDGFVTTYGQIVLTAQESGKFFEQREDLYMDNETFLVKLDGVVVAQLPMWDEAVSLAMKVLTEAHGVSDLVEVTTPDNPKPSFRYFYRWLTKKPS
jgi:hypothetical protein